MGSVWIERWGSRKQLKKHTGKETELGEYGASIRGLYLLYPHIFCPATRNQQTERNRWKEQAEHIQFSPLHVSMSYESLSPPPFSFPIFLSTESDLGFKQSSRIIHPTTMDNIKPVCCCHMNTNYFFFSLPSSTASFDRLHQATLYIPPHSVSILLFRPCPLAPAHRLITIIFFFFYFYFHTNFFELRITIIINTTTITID